MVDDKSFVGEPIKISTHLILQQFASDNSEFIPAH